MSKFTLPPSSRNLIGKSIQQIFDELKIRLLGPFATNTSSVVTHTPHNPTLSLPGIYTTAYLNNKTTTKPNFNNIQSLAAVTEQHLQNQAEKFKANAFAAIEQKLRDSAHKEDYDFEQELNDAIIEIFDQASGSTKQILETELHRTKTYSVTDSALEFAKESGDEDPSLYFLTRMDGKVCKICKDMYEHDDGTPIVYKQSELGNSYYDKGSPEPVFPPNTHPNCVLNGDARALTKQGYVPIKLLKIGDEVLTHKNRYQKVIATLNWYQELYHDEYYSLNLGHDQYGINVTPDHQLYTADGFKPIKDIKDSKVMTLQRKCAICDKYTVAKHPGYFCGDACRDKYLEDPVTLSSRLIKEPDYVLKEETVVISHNPSTLPSLLYDITVENDHSFIVNGIVSHNCRCLCLYLAKGIRVGPEGNLEYVGGDFDQYEEQRGLKKTVTDIANFFNHECDHGAEKI